MYRKCQIHITSEWGQFTRETASLAANWIISAQETVSGHIVSRELFISLMTSSLWIPKFLCEIVSVVNPFEFPRRIDPSQPCKNYTYDRETIIAKNLFQRPPLDTR